MRQDHTFEFKKKPKELSAPSSIDTGPPPIVWQLAFAHRVDHEISEGVFSNRSAAAWHYGITRARLTQLMNLLWLAPWIQEEILELKNGEEKRGRFTEHHLRKIHSKTPWKPVIE